jgi:hypothetical protein
MAMRYAVSIIAQGLKTIKLNLYNQRSNNTLGNWLFVGSSIYNRERISGTNYNEK